MTQRTSFNSRGDHDLTPYVGVVDGVEVADVVEGLVRRRPRVNDDGRVRAADRLRVVVVVRVCLAHFYAKRVLSFRRGTEP